MKRRFLVIALGAGMALAAAGVLASKSAVKVAAANDASAHDTTAPETTAVAVNYDGVLTPRYGIQAYAGISGPAWIVGATTYAAQEGIGHRLGSNHGDGRTGLTFTFSVNSAVTADAYLRVYGEFNEYSVGTYKVNDGEPANFNLRDMSAYSGIFWNLGVPAVLPISLTEGANTIQMVMGEDYTGWFDSFSISSVDGADDPGGPNETLFRNGNIVQKEAVAIDFAGESTITYGIQSYAGLAGPAWVVEELASPLQDGTSAHFMGSNAGDGRSGFEMTFKINSTVAYDVNLNIHAKIDGQATSGAVLNVNGTESNINFYDLNPNTWNAAIATPIPVSLNVGLNVIKITLQTNYTLWVGSWSLIPVGAPEVFPNYDEVTVGSWKEKGGYMSADGAAFGLNAFDNAADYGKTGSVTYKFNAPEEKDYHLIIDAMAGSALANRIRITLNEQVLQFDGKSYYSLDTSMGWSGDSRQTLVVHLIEGLNVLVFENELTWVNSARSQEVEPETAGAVQVSNWWVHGITLAEIPVRNLILDTSMAQTKFNLGRSFSAAGLKVSYQENDDVRELAENEYIIDSTRFNSGAMGSYEIKVTYLADSTLTASYLVVVGDDGVPFAGQTLEYTGEAMGLTHSFYNYAKIEGEGTGDCAGRLFWYTGDWRLTDDGFQFGSNGAGEYENRQVTLTLNIHSTVAGKHLFRMDTTSENRDHAGLTIKVNDAEAYEANLFYSGQGLPYAFEVDLVEGDNVIKLTTPNCYALWWRYFDIVPITYAELGHKFNANEGARWGQDVIDPDNGDLWAATGKARGLTFYYNVEEEGDYMLNMTTVAPTESAGQIIVDGVKACDFTASGAASVARFHLTAGNHAIQVYADASGSFGLKDVTLAADIRPDHLVLDTSAMNLEVPYDGIFDQTTLVVKLVYTDGHEEVLPVSAYKVTAPEGFSTTVPGSYVFTVALRADESISATFTVVVLEQDIPEPPTSSEEPPASSEDPGQPSEYSSETPVPSTPEEPKDGGNKVKVGCGGAIVGTAVAASVALIGVLAVALKKRKDD